MEYTVVTGFSGDSGSSFVEHAQNTKANVHIKIILLMAIDIN